MRLLGFAAILGLIALGYGNDLENAFGTCVTKVTSIEQCVSSVKSGLEKLSHYIDQIHKLEGHMKKVDDGFDTFSSVLRLAKYIPGVGTALNVLDGTIKAMRPTLSSAYDRVKAIDKKIYPWKSRVDQGVEAINSIGEIKEKCADAKTAYGRLAQTAECVSNAAPGLLKAIMEAQLSNVEKAEEAVTAGVSAINSGLGGVDSACQSVKAVASAVLQWPNIDFIVDAMEDMYDALEPILDFFGDIQSVLDKELCIPNPLDALEDLRELEILEEIAEGFKSWGWRRKRRSLLTDDSDDVSGVQALKKRTLAKISKESANTYLSVQKRGSLCVSAQDLLDGVGAIFDPLLDIVNDLIGEILDALPKFELPGVPNFSNIFNLNYNFNLPSFDFGNLDGLLSHFDIPNLFCPDTVYHECVLPRVRHVLRCTTING